MKSGLFGAVPTAVVVIGLVLLVGFLVFRWGMIRLRERPALRERRHRNYGLRRGWLSYAAYTYWRDLRWRDCGEVSDVEGLAVNGGRAAIPYLVDLLFDHRYGSHAARAIGNLGDPRGIAPLADALEEAKADPLSRLFRGKFAEALAQLLAEHPDPEFLPVLLANADDETLAPGGREATAVALGQLADERAIPYLARMLHLRGNTDTGKSAVGNAALEALVAIGTVKAAIQLLTPLEFDLIRGVWCVSRDERITAALGVLDTLGTGARPALPVLERLLTDFEESVRHYHAEPTARRNYHRLKREDDCGVTVVEAIVRLATDLALRKRAERYVAGVRQRQAEAEAETLAARERVKRENERLAAERAAERLGYYWSWSTGYVCLRCGESMGGRTDAPHLDPGEGVGHRNCPKCGLSFG